MRRKVQNEIERCIQRWRPRIKPVDSMKIGLAKDELKENIPKH
jgi:predicted component of type VI protein secretion system